MTRGPVDFSRLRILVVENRALMRRLLCEMLRGFGVAHIREARTVPKALENVYREAFDAVILDFFLGEMDGADFARRLRHDSTCRNRAVPILLVTGAPDHSKVVKALKAGIDDMLAKPVAPKDLHARLSDMVAGPRPFVVTPDYAGPMRRRQSRALSALHDSPRPRPRQQAATGAQRRGRASVLGMDEALFVN